MSFTSGFFNSIGGDRIYNARDMSMYFKGLISDGIFESVDDKLRVTAGGGMSVNIGSGRAIIDCQWANNDAAEKLNIDVPDVGTNRWDIIALRLDMSDGGRTITPVVKKGRSTPIGQFAPIPERIWTENIKELYLAQVTVSANKTEITQADIIDLRGTNFCGYVTGLIKQVDTADLFAQYQTAFEEYYSTMTAQFNAYIAAKQAAFDEWFKNLSEELNVNTYIQEYKQVTVTETDTNTIAVNIAAYTPATDVLFANINGVLFVENEDYTIDTTGNTPIIRLRMNITAGNTIEIRVLKSVIGMATNNAALTE